LCRRGLCRGGRRFGPALSARTPLGSRASLGSGTPLRPPPLHSPPHGPPAALGAALAFGALLGRARPFGCSCLDRCNHRRLFRREQHCHRRTGPDGQGEGRRDDARQSPIDRPAFEFREMTLMFPDGPAPHPPDDPRAK
jgi:hypothetical protein